MTKENPNSVIVESGNLVNDSSKLDFIVSVLKEMRYDAVGVGDSDLRIGRDKFFEVTGAKGLTVLYAASDAPKSTVPYVLKNVDGVKVGIVSFGAKPVNQDVNEYALRKALYSAYKAAREQSDILVVLDQANLVTKEWLERNGARLGAPDVVVGGVMRSGAMADEVVGKTHFVPTSVQGKSIGVADIEVAVGQETKFSVRKISIEPTVAENEGIAKRVKEIMGQAAVQSNGTPSTGTTGTPVVSQAPSGKPYYPPALCKACHIKEYKDWATTKHAVALKTIVDQERAIPECLKCHSEMYERLHRVDLTSTDQAGVECATCHMDCLPHGMERRNTTVRAKVNAKTCLVCHDKQWSPNYNEETYVVKVSHKGAGDSKTAMK